MAEYRDILRYLVLNPPLREPDKKMHATLLEQLAKKLRGEIKSEEKILNISSATRNRKYH